MMSPFDSPPDYPKGDENEDVNSEAQEETADVPMSMVGDVKEGDVVKLKVRSVDSENGTVTLCEVGADDYGDGKETKRMAAEFD